MKRYYVQYDLWQDQSAIPTIQKRYMEANSISDLLKKIEADHDGAKFQLRVAHTNDDNVIKDTEKPKRLFSRILLVLMSLFGLSMMLAGTISQIFGVR